MPSNVAGWTKPDLEARGAAWTAREIEQQPAVWAMVERLVATERPRLEAFLAPLLADPALRIVLTGAGTSAFIGKCLAPRLAAQLQRRVEAVATTDIVSGPTLQLQHQVPTLLVSFARSGNSPESVATIDLAERVLGSHGHHLIITCNAEGALAARGRELRNACVLVLPEPTNDRGFAMTSSFTSMLLSAALVFGAIRHERVAPLARAAERVLQATVPLAPRLVARGFKRVVYLGSNELHGLAAECALKLLELTDGRVVALAESTLGFRHGPKTIIDAQTLVVVMLSNDDYTRAYDRDLLEELRRDARAGGILALDARDEARQSDDHLLMAGLSDASNLEVALSCVLFAQTFALLQSLALGLTPDRPNAAGVVNRVVQGVTIHPWPESHADVSRR